MMVPFHPIYKCMFALLRPGKTKTTQFFSYRKNFVYNKQPTCTATDISGTDCIFPLDFFAFVSLIVAMKTIYDVSINYRKVKLHVKQYISKTTGEITIAPNRFSSTHPHNSLPWSDQESKWDSTYESQERQRRETERQRDRETAGETWIHRERRREIQRESEWDRET